MSSSNLSLDNASKEVGAAVPQAQGLQQSLKLLFMLVITGYLFAISSRLLLFPAAGAGANAHLLVPLTLTVLSIMVAWWRLSRPGIMWQAVIVLIALAGTASLAIAGGAFTLWPMPVSAALCSLLVALVGLQEAATRPRTWGLTARQWAVSALFVCAIIGIGLFVWFSHEGAGREAQMTARSVRVTLLVLLAWTATISLVVAGRPSMQARNWLFGIMYGALIASNFAILALDPWLNQFSSQGVSVPSQLLTLPFLAVAAVAGLVFPRWVNGIVLAVFMLAAWSQGAILASTNAVALGLAGLAGLFITTQRWPLAAAYWAALLAGPVIGIGITNPMLLVNAMAATIVFAGSYGLSRILEAYSEQREAGEEASDPAGLPDQAPPVLDRRSASFGVAAAAGVALISGALLYYTYNQDREKAQERAHAVAERLTDRIEFRLQAHQRLALALSGVGLEQVSTQAEFEAAVSELVPLLSEDAQLVWSPGGIVRFAEPLQGNEAVIGLDLLQRPEVWSGLEHVIETAEPHWTGPFALSNGKQGLAYSVPVYEPGAPPSRQTFIGFLAVTIELDEFFASILQFDEQESDVTVWLTNPSIPNAAEAPSLIWGSSSPDERYSDLAGVAEASGMQDGDGNRLTIRVEARPHQLEAFEALPARLQSLLILSLLAGIGTALFETNRSKTRFAQKLMRESEGKFRSLFEEAPDAFLLMDSSDQARIIDCNKTAEQMLGGTREEIIGKTPADLSPLFQPDGRPSIEAAQEHIREALQNGTDFEWVHQRLDGEEFWVEVTTSVMPYTDPQILIIAWRDLTERKAAEAGLLENELRYRSITQSSPSAIIVADESGHIIEWNAAAERSFGYAASEVIGQPLSLVTPPNLRDAHHAGFARYLETREPVLIGKGAVEVIALHKDGHELPVELSIETFSNDKKTFFTAAFIDITERKAAEAGLREREAQFRQLFLGSTAALVLVDKSGRIRMANHEACSVFEYADGEMIGMSVDLLLPEALRAGHKALRDGYFAEGAPTRLGSERDLQAVTKNGNVLDFELGLSRIEIGEEELVLASIIDISHRKRAERARGQFIANISHDLRTPLNAVLGYARMLEKAPLEGEHREQLQRLNQASNMLFGLVNDVLDWSKIEAGEIDLDNEPVHLASAYAIMESVMEGQARDKGLAFNCQKSPDLPHYVTGDATRFQQIMNNLIGNAIKFTEHGEVHVEASLLPCADPDKVRLRFEVSDTGMGISQQDQQYLFERFRQVDQSATRRFQGTGLGLAIVKELAELMGGCVKVESEPGVGSTFTVELEFDRCDDLPVALEGQQQGATGHSEEPLAGKHILLVDDSDLIVELTELLIETAGAQVSSCTNGQEALDWLANNPGKVDIVLMDVHMPVMDGNTAVAIMRRDPKLQHLPVIAMTAGATRTAIDEALAAGMTGCITKPFTEEQLIETVLKQGSTKGKKAR